MTPQPQQKSIWALFPIFGSILFILLYIIAAVLYPGGSGTDKNAIGYSWTNNYWCNLLNKKAINGELNVARPVAMSAMFILSLALSIFWFLFPLNIDVNKYLKRIIQYSGIAAMFVSFLLLTNADHDLVVNIASSFGVIATVGVMICLYHLKLQSLFAFGLFNIIFVGLNNYFYHTQGMMTYLPVVQKLTFLSFLPWISCISFTIYQRNMKVFQKTV